VWTVSGNKKVIDTFWPFPKQNKQTNNTTIITTNLERRGFDFIFKMLFALPKNSFPSQWSICSFSKYHPSSKTKNQFPISFNSTFVSLVSSNRRRVVIFCRHQQRDWNFEKAPKFWYSSQ
jgi:hypothetical protein